MKKLNSLKKENFYYVVLKIREKNHINNIQLYLNFENKKKTTKVTEKRETVPRRGFCQKPYWELK